MDSRNKASEKPEERKFRHNRVAWVRAWCRFGGDAEIIIESHLSISLIILVCIGNVPTDMPRHRFSASGRESSSPDESLMDDRVAKLKDELASTVAMLQSLVDIRPRVLSMPTMR